MPRRMKEEEQREFVGRGISTPHPSDQAPLEPQRPHSHKQPESKMKGLSEVIEKMFIVREL